MATSVIIDDYVLRKRSSLLFNENQFRAVQENWMKTDPLLMELQHFDAFKGRETWSELDAIHFRMLIVTTFTARDKKVDEKDRFNDNIPVVQSLYYLLMGLAYSIQSKTGLAVDVLRVNRVDESDVSFEFSLTMMADKKPLIQPPKPGFQVVVDNTKTK